jgi:arylsulfatase A-like enzyme
MADRPNILFVAIDDLRPQLNCYGHRQMVSPNIDRLAEQGVLFERAYCQVPVCGATRASLLTGARPTRNRFVTFECWADQEYPNALTLPQHFLQEGYTALSVGKIFHHGEDAADRSWSEAPWRPRGKVSWRDYLLPENVENAAAHNGRGPAFECSDAPDEAYCDGKTADRAIAELQRLSRDDKPFFLGVGFLKPHLPFNAPRKYWDYYKREEVNPADNPFRPEDAPDEALHNWGELRQYFDIPREGPLPEDMARTLVHGYYAATSYMDAQLGRVLDELERLDLHKNTIVVVWGDHGWQLGEHGLWCKHCNFETSLNAPLIFRVPDQMKGSRARGLVEFVDVYPTLCELAGIPLPDHLAGESLLPLLSDASRPGKPAAFSRYLSGDSIRTDRFLYTEWTSPEGDRTARMLYDHDADPDENVNLSERPEHQTTVVTLAQMLHEQQAQTLSVG